MATKREQNEIDEVRKRNNSLTDRKVNLRKVRNLSVSNAEMDSVSVPRTLADTR